MLPGFEATEPVDGLFFAVFPEAGAAGRITALAHRLLESHGLRGRPLAAGRLHVSLHKLGGYAGLPPSAVAAAVEAAAAVSMRPFTVRFDRGMTFERRHGPGPHVLLGGEGVIGLEALHRLLGSALSRSARAGFQPHVTLFYGDRRIAEHPIEPIDWIVREFVLVRSLVGRSRYQHLARWTLGG